MNSIDWKRVAKPQADGYDCEVLSSFLKKKYDWVKIKPNTKFTLCDGNVAVSSHPMKAYPKISDILNNDPEAIRQADIATHLQAIDLWSDKKAKELEIYLRQWNEGYTMLKLFLDVFWPLATFKKPNSGTTNPYIGAPLLFEIRNSTLEQIEIEYTDKCRNSRGCTSGHYSPPEYEISHRLPQYVNGIYVTIDNMQGCAQGIFHEVGHLRLNALNLEIERHDGRFFTNTQDELYVSPIRRDKKRPLSAVIQAIYSWLIFSENDLQCANIPENAMLSADYLITNLPKIEDGLITIRDNIKCTPEGVDFMDGYFEWGEDICSRARILCKQQFGESYTDRYNKASQYKNF